MTYNCDLCNKLYKSYQSLWNHNRNIHPDNNIYIINKDKKFTCKLCNKKFTRKDSLLLHSKNYCKNKNEKNEVQKENNNYDELKNEIIELKNQVNKLSGNIITNNSNNISNNISNNSNNNSNNNIIVINKIGSENINDLNEKEIKEIFSNNIESLIKFVQHTNFNSRLPFNHNFCTTSLDGQYLTVYNVEKSSQEKERKKYFFEELIKRSIIKMEKLYNKYRDNFNKEKQKKIEEDIMILKDIRDRDMNDILLREMLKKLNLLSYNYKEVIMKTWEKPDTIGMKEKTFEEDLDDNGSEMEIKEIESIFMKQDDDDESDDEKPKLEIKKKNNKMEIEI
jgi:hypothetical protein